MNYEEMSDWEVTKRVVEIRCAGQFIKYQPQRDAFEPIESGVMDDALYITTESGREQEIDCCNNPSDAWPIILKYGISINFDGIDWEADTSWMGSESSNRSYNNIERNAGKPLRAAMICFLKMKNTENE